ncbi:MAG: hypothetical protein WAM14_22950 [Candidatus Nitrosopolaris sp.]
MEEQHRNDENVSLRRRELKWLFRVTGNLDSLIISVIGRISGLVRQLQPSDQDITD